MRRCSCFGLLVAWAVLGSAPLTRAAVVQAQSLTPAASNLPASLVSSGQGEAKVSPDRVSVLVNVQTRAATAAAAATENARRTTSVLEALGRLGLSKDQLLTEGYSAYPEL